MTATPTNTTLIADLIQLSDLDFSKRRLEPKSAQSQEITLEATGVRARLPAAVLLHYDTRVSRGKRGAARMRNTTCGGCYLSLPSGQLADLRHANAELMMCCNCNIYLLPSLTEAADPAAAPAKPTTAAAKAKAAAAALASAIVLPAAVKKPRKVKVKAVAAAADTAEEVSAAAAAEAPDAEAPVEVEATDEAEAQAPTAAINADADTEATAKEAA